MSDKAKGTLILIICIILIVGCIRSCTHEHEWIEATCTEPQTCSSCKKTEGEPLGHDWSAATCTTPKTCRRCDITEGRRADHVWIDATCTEAESCSVCGTKRYWLAHALGHDWKNATCTAPKTCSRCGATEGEPQHSFSSSGWQTTIEPTCHSQGEESQACMKCGQVETRRLLAVNHKVGEWQIVEEATPSVEGTKKQYCVICGQEMGSMQYEYVAPPSNTSSGSGKNSGASGSTNSGGTNSGNGNNFNTYNNENQQNTTASYVLNTRTMKFHYPSCRDVPKISPSNYATSSQSRSELVSRGYSACGHCNP